jgi:hypothetical protein
MATEYYFGDYKPEEKTNPYIEMISDLADFDDESKAVIVTVDVNDAQNATNKIQRAANLVGKTARKRYTDESAVTTSKNADGDTEYEGDVKITFTLTKMHQARRGKKPKGDSVSDEAIAEFISEDATAA